MSDLIEQLLPPSFVIAGLVAVGVVAVCGCMRAGVFGDAPVRRAGVTMVDLFVGMCLLLAGMLAFGYIARAAGLVADAPEAPVSPLTSAKLALLSQAVTQLPIVAYLLFCARRAPNGYAELGVLPRRPAAELKAAALALLLAVPIVFASSTVFVVLSQLMGHKPPAIAHEMLRELLAANDNLTATVLMLTSAIIVAPLLEEFIFRGLLQTALLDMLGPTSRWSAIFIAAGVFAAIHANVANWHVIPGLFLLGLILGWLYEKTGSLLPGVLVHAGFNIVNVAIAYLLARQAG